jgi:glycosyltransferase involved in cell wall biosynthesis
MKSTTKTLLIILIAFLLILILVVVKRRKRITTVDAFSAADSATESATNYLDVLRRHKDEKHFPFRYLGDENGNILPIVFVSAFFRDQKERDTFSEYVNNGIVVAGITAYKTFPRPIVDRTADNQLGVDNPFDYYGLIKNWCCCMSHADNYGFDSSHNIVDISESDFYDVATDPKLTPSVDKKYDFVYSCLKDDDSNCPMDGWNAVNRNYQLALRCFPIMVNEFNLRGLVVGRVGCGLEKQYGGKIEVVDMLPYHEFQTQLENSRMLFVPNIYDASPRVVAEAISKNVPVLMNRGIVCGSKYINDETGELFRDEYDIRSSLTRLLGRIDTIKPNEWWKQNHSRKSAGKRLRDFFFAFAPEKVGNAQEVYFI